MISPEIKHAIIDYFVVSGSTLCPTREIRKQVTGKYRNNDDFDDTLRSLVDQGIMEMMFDTECRMTPASRAAFGITSH